MWSGAGEEDLLSLRPPTLESKLQILQASEKLLKRKPFNRVISTS